MVNQSPAAAPFFSYVLGAQWLGGLSGDQPLAPFLKGKALVHEAYRIMGEIGSNVIKIELSGKQLKKQGFDGAGYETMDKAVRHPYFKNLRCRSSDTMAREGRGLKVIWEISDQNQLSKYESTNDEK